MKLSAFGIPRELNWYQAIDYVKEIGLTSIEPFPHAELVEPDVKKAAKIGAYARQNGVDICCFSFGIDLLGRDDAVALLKKYADVCVALGSPYLHHTLITKYDAANDENTKKKFIDKVIPKAREVYDYAKSVGIECLYEDQGRCVNGTAMFGYFLEHMERANVGVVADLGNIRFADEEPLQFVKTFCKQIRHVHVKDYTVIERENTAGQNVHYRTQAGNFLHEETVGEGMAPLAEIFAALNEVGYNGYYSIEYEKQTDYRSAHIAGFRNMKRIFETVSRK